MEMLLLHLPAVFLIIDACGYSCVFLPGETVYT